MNSMSSALYMDGKRFTETEFLLEEDFEKVIQENSKTLFGSKTIYSDLKKKVDSKSLGSAVPDGFLFDFTNEESPEFYLVEVELKKHDFYEHMFPQITKFFAFFKNSVSRNNLIEKLYLLIDTNLELKDEFKKYLGKKEIFKTLKDTIENSQNILLILDEDKPEIQEVTDTYTDTWDKIVQKEILKRYTASGKEIFVMNPEFEGIGFVEPIKGDEEKYNENFHLEDVEKDIVTVYENIKTQVLGFDSKIIINPQKYYISLRKKKNFAYIQPRKKKIKITIMLPFENGNALIKKHKITQLSGGVQKFYNGPCFEVTIENNENIEEIIKALEEAYKQQN